MDGRNTGSFQASGVRASSRGLAPLAQGKEPAGSSGRAFQNDYSILLYLLDYLEMKGYCIGLKTISDYQSTLRSEGRIECHIRGGQIQAPDQRQSFWCTLLAVHVVVFPLD